MLTIKRKQKFYVFDEHTDYIAECKKLGFIPTKYDDYFVKQFICGEEKYDVYGRNECYSGWEINVVQSENYSFENLLSILLNSRIYDERVVSIGLILKKYYSLFLTAFTNDSFQGRLEKKKKIAKLILKDICKKSYDVSKMNELIVICKNICDR